MEVDQAHYPGRVGKMMCVCLCIGAANARRSIVNAPMFFSIIWGALRSWLNPVTEKKIQIVGCRAVDIRQALLELIDASQLPTDFGGHAPALPSGACSDAELACPMLMRALVQRPSSPPEIAESDDASSVQTASPANNGTATAVAAPLSAVAIERVQRPPREHLAKLLALDPSVPELKQALRAAIAAVEADTDAFERDALLVRIKLREDARHRRLLPTGIAALKTALAEASTERDAHAKAVAFAKNYIDADKDECVEAERRARARLERAMDENRGLRRTLEVTLGAAAVRRALARAAADLNVV